jgi:hypothetical protein
MKTLVAVYDRAGHAYPVVQAMIDLGVPREHLSLVAADPSSRRDDAEDPNVAERAVPTVEVMAGTAMGLGSLLVGLAALTIPAIGPVLAAGPLLAGVAASGGAATQEHLLSVLANAGVPAEDGQAFAEAVRRGGAIVLVTASDRDVRHYARALDRFGPCEPDAVPMRAAAGM